MALEDLVVISGFSGAGKSSAMNVFEDAGYFVVDNLPAEMIRSLADLFRHPGSKVTRACVVSDLRGGTYFEQLAGVLDELREQGVDPRVLFLTAGEETLETRLAACSAALSEEGEGWAIGCSHGAILLPDEAADTTDAMRLADQRMYARKTSGRRSPSRQSADVLLELLGQRDFELEGHTRRVASLARRAAERLGEHLDDANADNVFAGVYADGRGKRVTVFGVTGLRLTPEQDVEAQVARLTAEYDIREVERFDPGEPGVHQRCGVGRSGRSTMVVCAWADHGSLAIVMLTRRSLADSAELTSTLRSAVLTRG